jgi:SOS-response transcriptional repressor LexA
MYYSGYMIDETLTPGDRLRELRKRRGYSNAAQLAAAMGVSTSAVTHHENGTRDIPWSRAVSYARLLNANPQFILYGKDFNQVDENSGSLLTRKVALLTVPLLSSSDQAQFRLIAGGSRPMSDRSIFAPFDLPDGHRVFAVLMPDKGMESDGKQTINQGEPVFINPDAEHHIGDIVAVQLPDCEEILIRKYRRSSVDEGGVEKFDLVALNEDYGIERNISDRGAVIVGKVIGVYREL